MVFRHIFSHWTYETFPPGAILRSKYNAFKNLMELDETCLHRIAAIEAIHAGALHADWARVHSMATALNTDVRTMLEQLQYINPVRFIDLMDYFPKISFYMRMALSLPEPDITPPFVFPVPAALDRKKYAHATARALATLIHATQIPIPPGFVISSSAYHYFIEANDLRPVINALLCTVDPDIPEQTASIAQEIQEHIRHAQIPAAVARAIDIAAADIMQPGKHLELFADPCNGHDTEGLPNHRMQCSIKTSGNLCLAWRDAILAKYRAPAITERIRRGLGDSQAPMVTTVLLLPPATCTGNIITSGTFPQEKTSRNASRTTAVSIRTEELAQTVPPLFLERTPPHRILTAPDMAGITPHTAKKMAALGYEIEKILKNPQEISWILDSRTRIWITSILPAVPNRPTQRTGLDQGIPFIARRTLPSPGATAEFCPENSKSMYDLICFAREKSVEEMFALVNSSGLGLEGAKTFVTPPLSLQILNLADGLFPTAAGVHSITPNDIKSMPMWAVWFGLESQHGPADDADIFQDRAPDTPTIQGYAILSRTYLHLTASIDRHFAEIDAVCGPDETCNHVFFRFREGSPDTQKGTLVTMEKILQAEKFTLKRQGNMMEARHYGEGETSVQKKLAMLGILLENTRTGKLQTPALT